MKTFCYCYSLRIGSLVIATLGFIGSLAVYIYSCFGLLKAKDPWNAPKSEEAIFSALLVGASVSLLIQVLLIFGIQKKKSNLMLPWIIFSFIGCCLVTLALFMRFYSLFGVQDEIKIFIVETLVLMAYCIISWYFWICVWNHYKEVKDAQMIASSEIHFAHGIYNVTTKNKDGAIYMFGTPYC